jgi:hypothetical protein
MLLNEPRSSPPWTRELGSSPGKPGPRSRPRKRGAAWVARWGVLLGLAAVAPAARAEPPRICFDAVERGQSLRDQVKLRQARAAFLSCAADPCPALIQHDCAQWVADVDARLPTVIVTASDAAGRDLVDVRVLVDGEPFVTRLDGIAVPIDPGVHTFRFEPPNGPPVEQQAVLHEAEKYQKVHAVLQTPPVVVEPPPRIQPSPTPPPTHKKTVPTGAIVAGSIGVAALGAFTYFAIAGTSDVHHLNDTCAPNCSHSDSDAARRELLVADVTLGVGVAALAVAAWLYLASSEHVAARAPSMARPAGPLSFTF